MEGILSEHPFVPIDFGHRNLRDLGSVYHVYESPDKFTEIKADSAFEAMKRAQVTKPFKISRYALRHLNVLDCGMLDESNTEIAQSAAPPEERGVTYSP